MAVQKLQETGESGVYNFGNEQGFSVNQVLEACRNVAGCLLMQKQLQDAPVTRLY